MTTNPRTRRLLRRCTLAGSGVAAAGIALTVTLVAAVDNSAAATTNDTSGSANQSSTDNSSTNGSTTGGLSNGDQNSGSVGGSHGS